jgi:hypothetical protein
MLVEFLASVAFDAKYRHATSLLEVGSNLGRLGLILLAVGGVLGFTRLFRVLRSLLSTTEDLPYTDQTRACNGHIRFELGPIVAEQDRVCIQAESIATTTDGKSFNNLYHIFFEIKDGKIAYAREYNDTAHVLSSLRAQLPH